MDISKCGYLDASMNYSDTEGRAKIATLRFEKNSEILAKSRKTEIIMREFDLEAAKRGAAVCTRDGSCVRIVCTDCMGEDPIVALVNHETGEGVVACNSLGRYYRSADSDLDLFMCDDDYAEKLARGEYGNHIDEATEKVDPVIKENSTTDREYWRRVYAGQVMPILVDVVVREGRHVVKSGIGIADAVVEDSLKYAGALIEELEKQRNDE